jgi:hypothetical protein
MACFLNFFASGAFVLLEPLFVSAPGYGIARYGVAAGMICAGGIAGSLLTAAVPMTARLRPAVFFACAAVDCLGNAFFPFLPFPPGLAILTAGGAANSVINVMIFSPVQLQVGGAMRGKVFGLLSMLSQCIAPPAMALFGWLSAFLPLRGLIAAGYAANLLIFAVFALHAPLRSFLAVREK